MQVKVSILLGAADIYFARPYASYERGTKANEHKLIRRFFQSKRLADILSNTIKKDSTMGEQSTT